MGASFHQVVAGRWCRKPEGTYCIFVIMRCGVILLVCDLK